MIVLDKANLDFFCDFDIHLAWIYAFSQVIFEDLEAADAAMQEFQEDASLGESSSEFAKAFTAENYVNTQDEVIVLAAESWQQFKQKAKQIVVVC